MERSAVDATGLTHLGDQQRAERAGESPRRQHQAVEGAKDAPGIDRAQSHLQEQARDGDAPAVQGSALLIHHLRSVAESMIRAIAGRTCTSTEEPVLPTDRQVCRQFGRRFPGGRGHLLLAPQSAGMAWAERRCEGGGPHLASSRMRRDSGHAWRRAGMRRPRMVSMCITLLIAVALAADASRDEPPTLRAAEAGVSPGFCPALRALIDEAPGGFSALRGAARRGGEHMWEGSRRLPGASDCGGCGKVNIYTEADRIHLGSTATPLSIDSETRTLLSVV